eukprot:6347351-Prymnesium_polylepis.1
MARRAGGAVGGGAPRDAPLRRQGRATARRRAHAGDSARQCAAGVREGASARGRAARRTAARACCPAAR